MRMDDSSFMQIHPDYDSLYRNIGRKKATILYRNNNILPKYYSFVFVSSFT